MFPGFFLYSVWVCGVTKNCPNRESDGSPYNLYGGEPSAKTTAKLGCNQGLVVNFFKFAHFTLTSKMFRKSLFHVPYHRVKG